ncbi:hypothetical protein PGKDCPLP_02839 [Stenotrophomonas maltophilia]|nr:hypothetical protein PGKDCPLP_02839 [Stenotrophomonas maltophilia]
MRGQCQRLLGHVPGIGTGMHAHLLCTFTQIAQVQPQLAVGALDRRLHNGSFGSALEVTVEAVRAQQPKVVATVHIQRPALPQWRARYQCIAAWHLTQPQPIVDMQDRCRTFAGQHQFHARCVDRGNRCLRPIGQGTRRTYATFLLRRFQPLRQRRHGASRQGGGTCGRRAHVGQAAYERTGIALGEVEGVAQVSADRTAPG